jgi:hypothetical protein
LAFYPPTTSNPATLRLGSTVSLSDFIWSRSVTDASATHQTAMKLDSANKLQLFSPTNGTTPTITLDPAGQSTFNGPIRIAPQGDILMGQFGN